MREDLGKAPLMTADGTLRVRWDVVIAVVTVVVTAFTVYVNLTNRIATVELQQRIQSDDVREIKNDIKTLLRRSLP